MLVTPMMVISPCFTVLSTTLTSQFPPREVARSTTIEPGFICATVFWYNNIGAFLPGIKAVEIMMSASLAY